MFRKISGSIAVVQYLEDTLFFYSLQIRDSHQLEIKKSVARKCHGVMLHNQKSGSNVVRLQYNLRGSVMLERASVSVCQAKR